MNDLAESVDDLICINHELADSTMDTLAMLIFCWFLGAFFILWLGKLIFYKVCAPRNPKDVNNQASNAQYKSTTTDHIADKTTKLSNGTKTNEVNGINHVSSGNNLPTAPVRRRLVRQSSVKADISKPPKAVPPPECSGPHPECTAWVNELIKWLYKDPFVVQELLITWIQSINAFTKGLLKEEMDIELVRMLPETHPPLIFNVFAEPFTNLEVQVTCDCDASIAFQLRTCRQLADKTDISHYRLNVNRFRARLNFSITDRLHTSMKCDGWPDIKLSLAPVGTIKARRDDIEFEELISQTLVNGLRHVEVQWNLATFPTCPRYYRYVEAPPPVDDTAPPPEITTMQSIPPHAASSHPVEQKPAAGKIGSTHLDAQLKAQPGQHQLAIHSISAEGLKCTTISNQLEPFCVVEIDEPSQKFQTPIQTGVNSPTWFTRFQIDIHEATNEILFEIYDSSSRPFTFLGLAIIAVDEIIGNRSQYITAQLQNRPYENDTISGHITVEFQILASAPATTATETYLSPSNIPKRNSIRRTPVREVMLTDEMNGHMTTPNQHPGRMQQIGPRCNDVQIPIDNNMQKMQPQWTIPKITHTMDGDPPTMEAPSRSRSRTRGNTFFGTIKKRVAQMRNRSCSVGRRIGANEPYRTVSVDRNQHKNGHITSGNIDKNWESHSGRSSMSELSTYSSKSAQTYINEASTLILETFENGYVKHYLVPLSLAKRSKWRKKGIKMHVYNDHTFIAKHLPGSTICESCRKAISHSFGKQAYECRDCHLKCHKSCHVKVQDICPTSTIHNIELSMLPVLS